MNCIILPSNLIYLYQLWILTYGWFISPFLIFHTLPRQGTKKLVKLSADKGLSSLVWNDGIEETKIMTWQEFQPIGIWKLGGVGWWLTSSGTELYSHRLLNRTEMNRQAIANSAKHRSLLSLVIIKWNLLKGMNRKEIGFLGSIYEEYYTQGHMI